MRDRSALLVAQRRQSSSRRAWLVSAQHWLPVQARGSQLCPLRCEQCAQGPFHGRVTASKLTSGTTPLSCGAFQIPKWTRAKFEVSKEDLNPIKQDEKKGVLREYKWGDMVFNYGMFPQVRFAEPDGPLHRRSRSPQRREVLTGRYWTGHQPLFGSAPSASELGCLASLPTNV